ncbi:MAG TPA: serine/threonine-protein kinase [Polyangiaceae bacterium]|nr:serine/threonine-protein kinase [Polyangiaceae bacterium]
MLYDGKTKVDPLGSDSSSPREQSQLYASEGLLPEGSRFGPYIVGPCIGHGGMARIYRAEHEGLRRHVALKVLLDGFAQDAEGHERFLREGRIAAAIKHPNVVNIFDVGFQDSVPYLVMELLEGQDLEALMYSQGSMAEATLVDIVVPIVAGLAAVHDAGVVHRDLKPGNIFLARGRNDELEPRLLDFGISKAAESEQFKLTTARGLLMGTPLYMSPEAIQGGEITALSDQYSLGVVLYECCTGFNPFAADTLAETVRRVTLGDFPPVAQQNPAVSKRMARIVGRAMSLDPSHRFSSLREMGRELLFLAGQRTRITWSLSFGEVMPKRTGNLSALALPPRSTPPPRQYGRLSSAAAILFGLVLFGSAGALLWSSRGADAGAPAVSTQALKAPQSPVLPPPPPSSPAPAAPAPAPSAAPASGVVAPSASATQPARLVALAEAPSAREAPRPQAPAAVQPPAAPKAAPPVKKARTPAKPPPPPRRRAPPRNETPVATEAKPEWLPAPAQLAPVAPAQRDAAPVGTNSAPIFD